MHNLHPTIQLTQDIGEICKPLSHLNISYFCHVKIDKQNTFSTLCSNPDFFLHYVKNKYYNADIHMSAENLGNHVIWDSLEMSGLSDKMNQEAVDFGVDHTFTIIEKTKAGNDYFHFSTHLPCKAINQVYLSNMDLLKLFILGFKDKVKSSALLSSAYDYKFSIDGEADGYQMELSDCLVANNNRENFLRSLIVDTKTLAHSKVSSILEDNKINITKRETEVLVDLIRGRSARTIADNLELSQRTIEHYIENIKSKLSVQSKADIIEKIVDKLF